MAEITTKFYTVICLCFTVVHCACDSEERPPWVALEQFTDVGKPFIEFTCGAYLKRGERITWYKERDIILTTITQMKDGHRKIDLLWPLARLSSGDKIYCAKECPSESSTDYISYAQTLSKSISIDFHRIIPPLPDYWAVMVTPEKFEDFGKSFIEFTCWAHLHQRQLLSWYQIKDDNTISLARIQQENDYGYIKIKLQKTLEPSDNGTQLYCVKETMMANITLKKEGKSQQIPIVIQRRIETSQAPFITVRPSRDTIIFDENDELTFVCSGSEPVDNRDFTWRIIGIDMKMSYPEQSFDKSTKLNHLTLRPDPFYHKSQIICAQDYQMDIQLTDTDQIKYHYGELVISHSITLLHRTNREGIVWGPLLTPRTFVDYGEPATEFTCIAFLYQREVLSWYQTKDSKSTRLAMIQQENSYGYVEVGMRKTFHPSDNGTTLQCVKERIILAPDTPKPFKFEMTSHKEIIPLTFQRKIKAFETPYVTVEPSSEIVIFDEHDKLEFVCSGSEPVDGRRLSWYLQGTDTSITSPRDQKYNKYTNQNRLMLHMAHYHHRSQLYCGQNYIFELQHPNIDMIKTLNYGELARSEPITLLHRTQKDPLANIRVTPAHFKDVYKPFVEFTCFAFSFPDEVLFWYQSKGSNRSQDILRMVQLQNPYLKGEQWMKLTLKKTLEQSDNGSELYCAQQSVLRDGSFSDGQKSAPVLISFQRFIKPLKRAFVNVELNTYLVFFDVNTTLRLTCNGSEPVDGRVITWFRIDSNSNISIPENQTYVSSTTSNELQLSLNESYHQNQVYCAQGFLTYILADGSWRAQSYGELARSNMVTLIMRDTKAEMDNSRFSSQIPSNNSDMMKIGVVALSLILVVLAASAVFWAQRRRRRAPPATPVTHMTPATTDKDNTDCDDYVTLSRGTASPQVTYAVLDLPHAAPGAARAPPERVLYAEIASVYRP